MSQIRVRSLRVKLAGALLLTTLSALLIALVAIVAYDLRAYGRNWMADMGTQAELLGRMSAPALAFDDPRTARENLALMRLRPKVQAAAIYTARGGVFASYLRVPGGAPVPALPEVDGTRVEGRDLVLFRRIVDKGQILGTIYLRADYDVLDQLRAYLGIAFVVLLLVMAAALLVLSQLARVMTRPVLAIAGIAREVVQQRDYSRRAPKMSNDEVGVLADSFNDMLVEIERRTLDLEASNAELAREVAERAKAEAEVLSLNAALEDRVRDRTEQLEAANHELEAFAFSVSHDLRAPLRAIDGFGQALLEDFPDDVPEEAKRYLTRIRNSTLRMSQLIEDLLNLSRVSRGALDRGTVDLGELAQQVAHELEQQHPANPVTLSVWPDMVVRADPRLLRAALENLLGNAWKFTANTPEPRVEVGVLRDRGSEVFYVRDNGAGFSMDYAGKLFTPFQRLHSAAEFSGTGIGLATVQRIVLRHGGRIWADAKVGKGAAFFFTLGTDAAGERAAGAAQLHPTEGEAT